MARQTIEHFTDDLDGSPADRTVRLGYAGDEYELDLNGEHAAQLEAALERYLTAARPVSGRRTSGGRTTRRSTGRQASARSRPGRGAAGGDAGAVRAWAQANGVEVSARGRISGEVIAAYQAAQTAAESPETGASAGGTRGRRGARKAGAAAGRRPRKRSSASADSAATASADGESSTE